MKTAFLILVLSISLPFLGSAQDNYPVSANKPANVQPITATAPETLAPDATVSTNDFKLYPAAGWSTFTVEAKDLDKINIINKKGKIVNAVSANKTGDKTEFKTSNLRDGVYQIQAIFKNGNKTSKELTVTN